MSKFFALPIRSLSYHTRWRLLLLPYFGGVLLLVVLPALISFGLAFFHYDALSPPRWAGTINFLLAYTESNFNLSVANSLAFILLPTPLRVMGALLLARLMQRDGRALAWLRAAVYLPNVIPGVAFALAWLWILNPLFGPLNLALQAVGVMPPNWLIDPVWAKPALVFISFWQIGEGFLVCLAALADIPAELDEAAQIDGAGWASQFGYITLPLMAPILLLLAFRDAILTFQETFTAALIMTAGGPYYATYTLPFFVYEQAFDLLSFGPASAALWVMYGLTGLVVILLYLTARQWQIGTTDETFVL
jgi:multiple sugar transport system permease protein